MVRVGQDDPRLAEERAPEPLDEAVALGSVGHREFSTRHDLVKELVHGASGEFTPVVEDKLFHLSVVRDVSFNGSTDFFASLVDEEVDVNLTCGAVGETDDILEA